MEIEITPELLEQQAIKHNIHLYDVRTCSICESPIGYYFDNNLPENSNGTIKLKVIWENGCDCVSFGRAELRRWQDIVDLYNLNIDNVSFVEKFGKVWHLDELQPKSKLDIKTECKWRHVDVGMYGCNDYVYQTSCNTEFDADKTHKSKFCPNCGNVVV